MSSFDKVLALCLVALVAFAIGHASALVSVQETAAGATTVDPPPLPRADNAALAARLQRLETAHDRLVQHVDALVMARFGRCRNETLDESP